MLGEEKDYSLLPYRKECCLPDRDFTQFLQLCQITLQERWSRVSYGLIMTHTLTMPA